MKNKKSNNRIYHIDSSRNIAKSPYWFLVQIQKCSDDIAGWTRIMLKNKKDFRKVELHTWEVDDIFEYEGGYGQDVESRMSVPDNPEFCKYLIAKQMVEFNTKKLTKLKKDYKKACIDLSVAGNINKETK